MIYISWTHTHKPAISRYNYKRGSGETTNVLEIDLPAVQILQLLIILVYVISTKHNKK